MNENPKQTKASKSEKQQECRNRTAGTLETNTNRSRLGITQAMSDNEQNGGNAEEKKHINITVKSQVRNPKLWLGNTDRDTVACQVKIDEMWSTLQSSLCCEQDIAASSASSSLRHEQFFGGATHFCSSSSHPLLSLFGCFCLHLCRRAKNFNSRSSPGQSLRRFSLPTLRTKGSMHRLYVSCLMGKTSTQTVHQRC